jgi:hypothetical protein
MRTILAKEWNISLAGYSFTYADVDYDSQQYADKMADGLVNDNCYFWGQNETWQFLKP